MIEYNKSSIHSTVILNVVFLLFLPLILAVFKQSSWMIFPYLLLWTTIELYFDYSKYQPRRSTLSKFSKRFVATFAFNFFLIFGSSLIIQNVLPVFGFGYRTGLFATITILSVYIYVVSKLEALIDYPLYVN